MHALKYSAKSMLLVGYTLLFMVWSQVASSASMFWQVTNGQSEVFLLGSVHVATKDYYPLPDKIESSFDKADILVLEMNPLSMESQQQIMQMQMKAQYGPRDNLRNHVSKGTYRMLADYLASVNLPLEPMLQMKPSMLAVALSMAKLATLGYTPSNGIDMANDPFASK